MKNILIPTDFSLNANNAIHFALSFFKEEICNFYFLHVYTPPFYRMDYLLGGPEFSAVKDNCVKRSMIGLENTLQRVKENNKNPKHHSFSISSFNTLTDEVNKTILKKSIDLVVMGTKGASDFRKTIMGSNALHVSRKAMAPVIVIPKDYNYRELKTALFPTDYWSRYKNEELEQGLNLIKKNKANLIVLHLKENYRLADIQLENKKSLYKKVANISHTLIELRDGLMPQDVLTYLGNHNIDLLFIMQRKHSAAVQLFLPQNTEYLAAHSKVPILIVKDTSPLLKKKKRYSKSEAIISS